MLASTTLGAVALGAVAVTTTIPFVELSATVSTQTTITASLTVVPFSIDIGTVGFPVLVDQAKTYFLVSNNAHANLAAPIDTDDLSITLSGDLSKFKDSGALSIDNRVQALRTVSSSEVVYYDGKAGQVLTLVARGQDGTTAKSWVSGSAIEARIIERHHEIHTEALIAVETEVLANKTQFESDIISLDTDKADVVHAHVIADVTSLQGSLDAKAPTIHTHAANDITGITAYVRFREREYDVRDYLVGDGSTDDTAAHQQIYNAIETDQENAIIYYDNAVYKIGGALQDGSRVNAQLILPEVAITGRQYSVKHVGYSVPACSPSGYEPLDLPSGTRIKSTLASGSGTQPSVIAGRGPSGGYLDETDYLHVEFENIVFQTNANPSYSCINTRRLTTVAFRNCIVAAGSHMDVTQATQPTTTTSYGIILPQFNSGICQRLEGQVNVFGFYTGIKGGELMHAQNLGVWWCQRGLEFPFSYHASMIQRLLVFWCPVGAIWTDVHPVTIHQWDNEHTMSGETAWFATTADISDASNFGSGDITWLTVRASFGRESVFTVTGGTGLNIRELGS